MKILNLIFGFIGNYWEQICIGIVIGGLTFVSIDWWKQDVEIRQLKGQINLLTHEAAELSDKLDAYKKAEIDVQKSIEAANKNRQQIINVFQKEINTIRNQQIPKDCAGAINYGIKMKGDLMWPKAD